MMLKKQNGKYAMVATPRKPPIISMNSAIQRAGVIHIDVALQILNAVHAVDGREDGIIQALRTRLNQMIRARDRRAIGFGVVIPGGMTNVKTAMTTTSSARTV
jgi:hypothetical protein